MILAHPTFESMIEFREDMVTALTVENPRRFSSYISELNSQINGETGEFSLFYNDRELPIS